MLIPICSCFLFQLSHGIVVNIGPNFAVQILNPEKNISLSLSGCATQMALVHPQGRVLQYNSRIEVRNFVIEGVACQSPSS